MKKIRILTLLLAVLMIAAVGCATNDGTNNANTSAPDSGTEATETPAGTVKFAVVGPMTGGSAIYGQYMVGGVTLAIEDWIAEKGGLNGANVEIEIFDDQAVANQALIVSQRIASNPTFLGIVGHLNSGCTLAGLPTYKDAGMVQISGSSTNVDLPFQGFDFFRTIMDDTGNVSEMLKLGIEGVGVKKVCIAYENTDYGIGTYDKMVEFMQRDYPQIELVQSAGFDPQQDKDFTAMITRFKATDADAVFFTGEYTTLSIFLTQAASLAYHPTMICSQALLNPATIEIAGEAAEGYYTLNPYYPHGKDYERAFNERYLAFTNGASEATEHVAHMHDAMLAWLKFFEWHGSNKASYDEIVSGLKAMPAFMGATGSIKFDQNGNVETKPFSYVVVKNGEFVPFTW